MSPFPPRPRRALLAVLAPAAVALLAPAAARADTFCVHAAAACPSFGIDRGDDLHAALAAAETHPGADEVLVGDKGSPYDGAPYAANLFSVLTEPLTIRGVGPGRPVIAANEDQTGSLLLGDETSLTHVDVRAPDSQDNETTALRASDTRLRDVRVLGSAENARGNVGLFVVNGRTDADDLRVDLPGDRPSTAVKVPLGGVLAGDRVSVTSRQGLVTRGGSVSLVHARIDAARQPVDQVEGSVSISRSVLTGMQDSGPTGVEVGDGTVALDHVTLAPRGTVARPRTGVLAKTAGKGTSVFLTDVAMGGFEHTIRRSETGSFTTKVFATRSVWRHAGDDPGFLAENTDADAEPAFVDRAAGDLRLTATSPAIDRDTGGNAAAYADAAGQATVDGDADGVALPDTGGLEYRRQAPVAAKLAIPASGTVGRPLAFSVSPADPDGDRVQVLWRFGDGGTAGGASPVHAYGRAGAFPVGVVLRDDAGVETVRTGTVFVAAPPAPPPGPTPTPVPKPRDRTAPVLRTVRLAPARVRPSRRARVRLLLRSSEPARLRVAVRGRPAMTFRIGRGANAVALTRALRARHLLRRGRAVTLRISAVDRAGNRSRTRRLVLRVR